MEYRTKRALCKRAVCLTVLLLVLTLPVSAFAEETHPEAVFPVTVRVTGEESPAPEEYSLRLTAIDHAPMPNAEEGMILDMTGPGTASFPPIVYEAVGIYRYTISQLPGETPGARYDARVCSVTVTVTNAEEGDGLHLTTAITKDGKKQDAAEFVNDYTKKPDANGGSSQPGKADTPHTDELIQTGQRRWPGWLLGGAGAVLVVLGMLFLRKRGTDAV